MELLRLGKDEILSLLAVEAWVASEKELLM